MRRLILAATLVAALSSPALGVDEFIETARVWKVFKLAGSTDHILKIADFDYDGDGKLDISAIQQIAYFGSSAEDTCYIHLDQGWWPNPLPPSSEAAVPVRSKRLTQIKQAPHPSLAAAGVAVPDSTVLRYKVVGVSTVYLMIWGS